MHQMDEELILHPANNTRSTQQMFIECLLFLAVGGQESRDRRETISLSREFGARRLWPIVFIPQGKVLCLCA